MRTAFRTALVIAVLSLVTTAADAARVRVVRRPHRTTVTVRAGFPLHRTLPHVYVRAPRVAVRVTPRVFLPPVVFGATVVAIADADTQVWHQRETLAADDEWTDLTLNVDRRGSRLVLQIEDGAARLSFAEVVFDNGEAQVVDFDDEVHAPGVYSLLDFKDGRKVDHVRVVAKAEGERSGLTLRLIG